MVNLRSAVTRDLKRASGPPKRCWVVVISRKASSIE